LELDEEPAGLKTGRKEEALLKSYEKEQQAAKGEQWGKEKYENSDPDKIFAKFERRLARASDQCLRYCFDGVPLWISEKVPSDIPNCEHCGAKRVYEMQLMPTMISMALHATKKQPLKERIEFGVVALFVCSRTCYPKSSSYVKEYVFVQAAV
jgi:pre-rRNA-processing protein TSR4